MSSATGLMEFGHIRRIQDTRFPYEVAVILPGEYFRQSGTQGGVYRLGFLYFCVFA